MEHEGLKTKTVKNTTKGHARKPYAKPQLIEYGKIEKLTESGASPGADVASRARR